MTQCIALSFYIGSRSRESLTEGLLSNLSKKSDISGRLVFLPGNPPYEPWKRQVSDHDWAKGIAKKYGIYLFAEKGNYEKNDPFSKGIFLFSPDARRVNVTGEQLVFKSNCPRENYEKLAERINAGSSSRTVAGRKVTIAICGENLIVIAKKEKPQWRSPECAIKKPSGIFFNPIHTQMGRKKLCEKRFKFLTKGGGYQHAIALANSYHGTARGKTWPENGGFALFTNGKKIDTPIAVEFGEDCGIPQGLAFTFAL